jgi:hypothetical protein
MPARHAAPAFHGLRRRVKQLAAAGWRVSGGVFLQVSLFVRLRSCSFVSRAKIADFRIATVRCGFVAQRSSGCPARVSNLRRRPEAPGEPWRRRVKTSRNVFARRYERIDRERPDPRARDRIARDRIARDRIARERLAACPRRREAPRWAARVRPRSRPVATRVRC